MEGGGGGGRWRRAGFCGSKEKDEHLSPWQSFDFNSLWTKMARGRSSVPSLADSNTTRCKKEQHEILVCGCKDNIKQSRHFTFITTENED